MVRGRGFTTLVASAAITAGLAVATPAAVAATTAGGTAATAPGAPGAPSYFDLARKDCVGTAAAQGSKVWYTVAGGVLSDVYEPTIDNTDVSTLQYVVTDGSTFTDLQTRDMTYTVTADPTGMACTVTSTDAKHGFRLITTYITDPARDTVLMQTALKNLPGSGTNVSRLHLYARLDAHVNGNGGGGSENAGANSGVVDTSTGASVPVIFSTNTVTNAVNRDYAVPTYMALAASTPVQTASVGYAGTASDGLTQLDASHALTPLYDSAPGGHIVATEDVTPAHGNSVTLALGFGRTQAQSLSVAEGSLSSPFGQTAARYRNGWTMYDAGLRPPAASFPGLGPSQAASLDSHYYLSANVLKASEDKTYPGAIVASLASPWGQSVPAGVTANGEPSYFGSYREVFARDLYEAFTGLLADGDVATARAATLFLFDRQQLPSGAMPRNSLLNGQAAPDTGGTQLDEAAYPILMAYLAGLGGDSALWKDHIRPAADFLVANGPSDGVERWEEQTGYSPSTIAAEIAGLTAASAIAASHGDTGPGQAVPGHRRRLPAQHQVLDGDDHRPGRPALLHPAVQDRRSERGHQLQPRQRRPHPGPAFGHRRRLPGTGAARRASGQRPRRAGVPGRAGQADLGVHAERDRLLPLRQLRHRGQRRRVRGLLPAEPDLVHDPRRPVAADRHRHRAPVAEPVRRARRVRPRLKGMPAARSPCSRR